jgi:hypothetical protein
MYSEIMVKPILQASFIESHKNVLVLLINPYCITISQLFIRMSVYYEDLYEIDPLIERLQYFVASLCDLKVPESQRKRIGLRYSRTPGRLL